ncbi:phosphoglycerate mutase family protein [Psychroserpens ponticola]|uniref:Phosphoglycerate mutase family protein n=1 Tax=Psychroserpens ponticola TaxID=2932268 RepID=A0ABY7RTP8_9FLAO|nr:phosphoglycerate mutase family protein [Psychroserpens ponticola]WCO00490.1 phosphoglycerate mutase family protein [Psychroserpens ponticola]
MKYFLILAFALSFIIPVKAQEQTKPSTTTYYLIRHAEKDRSDTTNKNPNLNDAGTKRAENWSKVFEHIDFDAVYSTKYYRTYETANPTAKTKGLEIQFYDPRQLYSEEFAEETYGKTVLVVGHSNTTPAFVNAILGEKKYENINDNDNSYLFIVTISEGHKIDQVLKIN